MFLWLSRSGFICPILRESERGMSTLGCCRCDLPLGLLDGEGPTILELSEDDCLEGHDLLSATEVADKDFPDLLQIGRFPKARGVQTFFFLFQTGPDLIM